MGKEGEYDPQTGTVPPVSRAVSAGLSSPGSFQPTGVPSCHAWLAPEGFMEGIFTNCHLLAGSHSWTHQDLVATCSLAEERELLGTHICVSG